MELAFFFVLCASLLGFFTLFFCMDYYGKISKGYDALHSEEQAAKACAIMANCPIHGLLLDIGAGTGTTTALFAGKADCIALDPSKEMLLHFSGLRVVAKAEQLPFKNRCFDSVISITALHHADLAMAVPELFRVAKQDACIAISFFKKAKNFAPAKKRLAGFRQIDAEKDLIFVNQ
jgi:ubiquinone/menaquinone biosynthesis C-methylase UbiE